MSSRLSIVTRFARSSPLACHPQIASANASPSWPYARRRIAARSFSLRPGNERAMPAQHVEGDERDDAAERVEERQRPAPQRAQEECHAKPRLRVARRIAHRPRHSRESGNPDLTYDVGTRSTQASRQGWIPAFVGTTRASADLRARRRCMPSAPSTARPRAATAAGALNALGTLGAREAVRFELVVLLRAQL